jgi:hypothetical protein
MKIKHIAANLFFASFAISIAGYLYVRDAVRERSHWFD